VCVRKLQLASKLDKAAFGSRRSFPSARLQPVLGKDGEPAFIDSSQLATARMLLASFLVVPQAELAESGPSLATPPSTSRSLRKRAAKKQLPTTSALDDESIDAEASDSDSIAVIMPRRARGSRKRTGPASRSRIVDSDSTGGGGGGGDEFFDDFLLPSQRALQASSVATQRTKGNLVIAAKQLTDAHSPNDHIERSAARQQQLSHSPQKPPPYQHYPAPHYHQPSHHHQQPPLYYHQPQQSSLYYAHQQPIAAYQSQPGTYYGGGQHQPQQPIVYGQPPALHSAYGQPPPAECAVARGVPPRMNWPTQTPQSASAQPSGELASINAHAGAMSLLRSAHQRRQDEFECSALKMHLDTLSSLTRHHKIYVGLVGPSESYFLFLL
jgi:hypothetical protein